MSFLPAHELRRPSDIRDGDMVIINDQQRLVVWVGNTTSAKVYSLILDDLSGNEHEIRISSDDRLRVVVTKEG